MSTPAEAFLLGISSGPACLASCGPVLLPVLAAVVLLTWATLEPTYCAWLCPFKTVTEFAEVTSLEAALQTGIFVSLFAGLVVVLPFLSRKRTQCSFLCPFGAFQSIFNKTDAFEIRVEPSKCADCALCEKACPTFSITRESAKAGKPLLSCMKCGACVDVCRKGAAVWHIKGTRVGAAPERARLLYLYAAWGFAVMFGGSIIAGSLQKLMGLFV